MACPQLLQKRAPGVLAAPQLLQKDWLGAAVAVGVVAWRPCPQLVQKALLAGTSW
jgi:hypothetical protein